MKEADTSIEKWTNEEYKTLLNAIKTSEGKDWNSVFSLFPNKKEEDVILNFLKMPFMNLTNLFALEQKPILDRLSHAPEVDFSRLSQEPGKVTNPLEPHFSIFKEYLNTFKNSGKKSQQSRSPCDQETLEKKKNLSSFNKLVDLQIDIIKNKISYLQEYEDIINHEKSQINQYNKRFFKARLINKVFENAYKQMTISQLISINKPAHGGTNQMISDSDYIMREKNPDSFSHQMHQEMTVQKPTNEIYDEQLSRPNNNNEINNEISG